MQTTLKATLNAGQPILSASQSTFFSYSPIFDTQYLLLPYPHTQQLTVSEFTQKLSSLQEFLQPSLLPGFTLTSSLLLLLFYFSLIIEIN